MAVTVMRNKLDGSTKKMEAGSEEYLELALERQEDHPGRTVWEDAGVGGHDEEDIAPPTDGSKTGADPVATRKSRLRRGVEPDEKEVAKQQREREKEEAKK